MTQERVTKTIAGSELFTRDVLREAGREDLYIWVRENGLQDEVVDAIARLSIREGGEVTGVGGQKASGPDQLRALIGGTWHVDISKDGWKIAVHSVVIAVSVLRASLGDLIEMGTLGGEFVLLVDELLRVVHKLNPNQVQIYLAVKATVKEQHDGASLAEISEILRSINTDQSSQTEGDLESTMMDLVSRGVLECRDGKFRAL